MAEKTIILRDQEAVKAFVQAASKCPYDVDVSYDRVVVDAKSIIGVMSLDRRRSLKVNYQEDDEAFREVLERYEV